MNVTPIIDMNESVSEIGRPSRATGRPCDVIASAQPPPPPSSSSLMELPRTIYDFKRDTFLTTVQQNNKVIDHLKTNNKLLFALLVIGTVIMVFLVFIAVLSCFK